MTDVLVTSRDTGHRMPSGRYSLFADDEEIVDVAGYHHWFGTTSPDGTKVAGVRNLTGAGPPGYVPLYASGALDLWRSDLDGSNYDVLIDGIIGGRPFYCAEGILVFMLDVGGVGIAIIDDTDGSVVRWVVDPSATPVTDPSCGPWGFAWCQGSDVRGTAAGRFTLPLPAWLTAENAHVGLRHAQPAKTHFDPAPDPLHRWPTAYMVKNAAGQWSLELCGPGREVLELVAPQPLNVALGPPQWRTDGSGVVFQRIDTDAAVAADAGWQVWTVDRDGTNLERFVSVLGDHVSFPYLGTRADDAITKASVIANAGLTGAQTSTVSSDYTQSTSGTQGSPIVVADKHFTSGVKINNGVHDVTFRNCRIEGEWGGSDSCVTGFANGARVRFENCEIGDSATSAAFGAGGVTLYRCDIHSSSDGGKLGDVDIQQCWIHALRDGPGDHSDGLQGQQGGGANTLVRHCVIIGPTAIRLSNEAQPETDLDDIVIDSNWLDGTANGPYIFAFHGTAVEGGLTYGTLTNCRVTNNRFGRTWLYGPTDNSGWTPGSNGNVWSGNEYEDDDSPVSF